MPQCNYGQTLSCGGVSISETLVRTGDHPNSFEVAVPAAKTGPLSTRTDANTGIVTPGSGHDMLAGQLVDVYWDGGSRYDMQVTGVTTNTVSIDGGSGDNLPTQGITVIICAQLRIEATINGVALLILGLELKYTNRLAASVGRIRFDNANGNQIHEVELAANSPQVWDIEGGADNPFMDVGFSETIDGEGQPARISNAQVSHNNTTSGATLKIVSLENLTG